jgi:hypothetical protein
MKTLLKREYPNGTKVQLLFAEVLQRYFTIITNPLNPKKIAQGMDFETEEDARKHIAKRLVEIDKEIEAKKEQEAHYWFQDI